MNRGTPWAWTATGVVLDREVDGSVEQVWLNPDLPPERDRRALPVAMEVFCCFWDLDKLGEGLLELWEGFGRDSVLVAVRRRDNTSRVLVYTAARESAIHERYLAVRGVLRPTAMGLRVVREPAWDSLGEVLASLEPKSESPIAARATRSDPPGASR